MTRFWHELTPQILCVAFLIGVLGNLIASLLWAIPALTHLHRKLDRHHAERMAQAERHHRGVMSALDTKDGQAVMAAVREMSKRSAGRFPGGLA